MSGGLFQNRPSAKAMQKMKGERKKHSELGLKLPHLQCISEQLKFTLKLE